MQKVDKLVTKITVDDVVVSRFLAEVSIMSILFIHEKSSVTFKIKVINVSVHLEKTTVTGGLLRNLWRHESGFGNIAGDTT